MEFYKNGVSQGRAWSNEIFGGSYFPCISLYKNATVSVNFGPKFKFSPKNHPNAKAVSVRAYESMIQCCAADLVYAVELETEGDKC